MKEITFSRAAEAALGEIFDYSIANWGRARATAYKRRLLVRIRTLAHGEPPCARSCAVLMAGKRPAAGLGYVREGSHFIILRETAERIEVVEFSIKAAIWSGWSTDLQAPSGTTTRRTDRVLERLSVNCNDR